MCHLSPLHRDRLRCKHLQLHLADPRPSLPFHLHRNIVTSPAAQHISPFEMDCTARCFPHHHSHRYNASQQSLGHPTTTQSNRLHTQQNLGLRSSPQPSNLCCCYSPMTPTSQQATHALIRRHFSFSKPIQMTVFRKSARRRQRNGSQIMIQHISFTRTVFPSPSLALNPTKAWMNY